MGLVLFVVVCFGLVVGNGNLLKNAKDLKGDRLSAVNALKDWIKRDGGFIADGNKVMTILGKGESVVASTSFRKGEELLLVRASQIPSPKSMMNHYPDIAALGLQENSLMGLALAIEKFAIPKNAGFFGFGGEKGHFGPFVSSLSTKCFNSVMMDEEDIKFLLKSVSAEEFGEKEATEQGLMDIYSSKIANSGLKWNVTFNEFRWGVCTFMTRSFERGFMLPFGDFYNHDGTAPNTKVEFFRGPMEQDDIIQCVVTALKPIKKGEEITFSYGPKDNFALLMSYGFVLDENPHDRIVLPPVRREWRFLVLRNCWI